MRKKKRATQAAVAKRCKMSTSSVNKILTHGSRPGSTFTDATIARVWAAARSLGYEPRPHDKAVMLERIMSLERENANLRKQVDRLFATRLRTPALEAAGKLG